MLIAGSYHDGKTSRSLSANLEVVQGKQDTIRISFIGDETSPDKPVYTSFSELKIASRLGNTPREMMFANDQLFVTDDNDAVDQLIKQHRQSDSHSWLHKLENNTPLILISVIVTGFVVWATMVYGVPAAAKTIAHQLPAFASEKLGSSLSILDQTVFEPSQLNKTRQEEIRRLTEPYLKDFEHLQPKLAFRSGMKANALALPGGEIVLTDDFVNLVANNQELLAVFFHEIGHLKHKHILRRALQDSMVSLIIIFVTGDVDSFDLLTGLPTLILDLSYSREFEREADLFALEQLHHYKISVDHFASVMERLENYYEEQESQTEEVIGKVLNKNKQTTEATEEDLVKDKPEESDTGFLSTHPGTKDRVKMIKEFKLKYEN